MTQILLDYPAEWPAEGALKIDARFQGEIPISPDYARRKASGYLSMYVVFFAHPKNPVLIVGEQPVWKMDVWLRMRGYGEIAQIGVIKVNALTGVPIEFSQAEILAMQERANAAVKYLPPVPATIG